MFIRKLLLIVSFAILIIFYLMNYDFYDVQSEEKDFVNISVGWLKSLNAVSSIEKDKSVEDVLFVLYIPRIELKENVYTMDSSNNNVDYHVQILDGSNIDDNFLFLAGHSGSGSASYFNRLNELEKGDVIWIDKEYEKLSFVVETIFYIPKNGYLEYSSLESKNILYLITCSLEYSDKQLVVKSSLVD